jgi:response regulator RpfG family c-di-GMP phosphodiesterase
MTRPFGKRSDRQLKNVLLVENGSSARDRHSATLARNGYQVETSESIESAQDLFAPRKYGLVVVALNGFGEAAAAFCNDIKEMHPEQIIALIFHPDQELPATDCPTLIFTTEPDEYFLARVETLTSAHAA